MLLLSPYLILIKLAQRGQAGSILSKVTEPNVLTQLREQRREELPGEGPVVHGPQRSKTALLSLFCPVSLVPPPGEVHIQAFPPKICVVQ